MADKGAGNIDAEKLAKLQAKAAAARTGGKGTVRRKKKVVHKNNATDDKKLQATLKRLGVNTIPGIEEVNIFKEDTNVIHFTNPKVQAAIGANTYVVSGNAEIKSFSEVGLGAFGGIADLEALKKMAAAQGFGGAAGDDEEPPELVNFEQAASS